MDYQAVVLFDLDGTLLTSNKTILPSSLKAIRQLKQNNILPVIATGRNIILVKDIMKQTKIDSAILGNGNYIILNNKPIFKSVIKPQILSKFISKANSLHNPITYQSTHAIALNSKNKLTVHEYNEKHHTNPKVDKDFPKKHQVIGCNVFTLKNDKIYQNDFRNELDIVRNSDMCLDVQNIGINKGSSINIILRTLQDANIPTYAFGDGRNDVPMLEDATYGIAMSNGGYQAKSVSDYITDSNNTDGIVKGLKHFELI